MKIECDELLVICDNCGHAIHVKELDNNLIKLNNKNDKLISEQDAIDALIEWYGCEPNGMDYFKEILAKKSPAQPVDKDINVPTNDTISRQAAKDRLTILVNEIEGIFADVRERNVDDSVCGLCEYDCDHGIDGSAFECPGFERDDCFKLKDEYREEWTDVKALPSAQQWIPVGERLPEDIKPVIVTWENIDPKSYYQYTVGKRFIGTAHYKNGKWFWYSSVTEDLLAEYGRCDSEEFDEAIEVISWMPLPEPYKEG